MHSPGPRRKDVLAAGLSNLECPGAGHRRKEAYGVEFSLILGDDIMRFLFAATACAFLAGQAFAADSLDCRDPMNQNTMNMCAERDFEAADRELNKVYGEVMKALDDESYKAKLKLAQRAWIQFRDTECTFETAENEGGSIHPLVYAGCETRLTKARTKELRDYLVCFKDAEKCGM